MKEACIICGLETKELNNKMCPLCFKLAEGKFFEIKNVFLARKFYKDYMHQDPNTYKFKNNETGKENTAKEYLDGIYEKYPADKYIIGIMPSTCPFCFNMATNRGAFQILARDSEEYKKFVVGNEIPKLVCKTCGDLTLYLRHAYTLTRPQVISVMNFITPMRKIIKDEGLELCEECGLKHIKKAEYTQEQKDKAKLKKKKYLCEDCR